MASGEISHPETDDSREIYRRFNECRQTSSFSDFTIISGENERHAVHRVLLVAWSDYMQMYLMNSSFSDNKNEVKLEGVTDEVLNVIFIQTIEISIWMLIFIA